MPDLSKYSVLQILMLLQQGVLAYSPDTLPKAVPAGKTKIYEELSSGRLRAKKLGDKTVIPFWAVIDWVAALPDYPVTPTTDEASSNKALAELRQELSNFNPATIAIDAGASVKILTKDSQND